MSLKQIPQSIAGSVSDNRNYLDYLTDKYILKLKNRTRGIDGFVFDYNLDTTISLNSVITDHYAEDNSTLQDHIAFRPITLNLRGYVGELVRSSDSGFLGISNAVTRKLSTIPAYLGTYTDGSISKINAILNQSVSVVNQVNSALNETTNFIKVFSGAAPSLTNQAKAFEFLEALWKSKRLFTVETPYKNYINMAIESVKFIQPEETKSMSDIAVTVKQMRFASVTFGSFDPSQFQERTSLQKSEEKDKGRTLGKDTSSSTTLLNLTSKLGLFKQ